MIHKQLKFSSQIRIQEVFKEKKQFNFILEMMNQVMFAQSIGSNHYRKFLLTRMNSKKFKSTLGNRDLAFWNPEIHDLHDETDYLTICISSSSTDIRQTEKVIVKSTNSAIQEITIHSFACLHIAQ